MELEAELALIADAAAAEQGDRLAAVIPTEPSPAAASISVRTRRSRDRGWRSTPRARWSASDALVRAAVSVAALAELAEESAGGGKLEELRQQLVALRVTEAPEGSRTPRRRRSRSSGRSPRRRGSPRPTYLDAIGFAARRLEQALGEIGSSPFAEAMKNASPLISELESEVLAGYRGELS